jgi:ABC-type oligopeptide transport system substrate-binding subunit
MALRKFFCEVTSLSKILSAVISIVLPFVGFWLGMQYGSGTQQNGEAVNYYKNTETLSPPKTMKLTIHNDESAVFEGLTVTNIDGGHKILQSPDGGRGGDLSFAEIELKADGVETVKMRVYAPSDGKYDPGNDTYFGAYRISVMDVGWNGDPVELSVETVEG